jgi:hypothetical protein
LKAADFGEVGIEPVIAELEALVTLLEGVPSRLRRRIINPNTGSNTAEKTFRRIYEEILEIPEPTD